MEKEPSNTWSPPWQEELSLFGSTEVRDGTRVWLLDGVERLLGESWTPDISEWPSGGEEFSLRSLSETLQKIGRSDPYWLSPRACEGILRRASRRGKELPEVLQKALTEQAGSD